MSQPTQDTKQKYTDPIGDLTRMYQQLEEVVGDRKLSPQNAAAICTAYMKLTEATRLPGAKKKELVLEVVKRYAKEHLDGEEEANMLMFTDLFLPSIIDTFVSVANGRITFSTDEGDCCCPIFSSSK